jgi:hypothetical protein
VFVGRQDPVLALLLLVPLFSLLGGEQLTVIFVPLLAAGGEATAPVMVAPRFWLPVVQLIPAEFAAQVGLGGGEFIASASTAKFPLTPPLSFFLPLPLTALLLFRPTSCTIETQILNYLQIYFCLQDILY